MYGTLDELDDGRFQLRFTRTLAHHQDTVWRRGAEPPWLMELRWVPGQE